MDCRLNSSIHQRSQRSGAQEMSRPISQIIENLPFEELINTHTPTNSSRLPVITLTVDIGNCHSIFLANNVFQIVTLCNCQIGDLNAC